MSRRRFYLAVDTATEACSVAVWRDGSVHELYREAPNEHTQLLLPMIEQALAATGGDVAALSGIACGIGPGSFAGLRIGLGVVKGLALARDIPVVGVSSLQMLAQRAMRQPGVDAVAAVIDARMGEVYAGAYRREADGRAMPVWEDRVGKAAGLPPLSEGNWVGAGTGWGVYEAALRAALGPRIAGVDARALPHAEDALRIAVPLLESGQGGSADALAPAYLRDRVALTLEEQRAGVRLN